MKRTFSSTNLTIHPLLNNIDDILRTSEHNIVLFGKCGYGKTFLLNKVCGTNFQVAEEGYSCTQTVQYSFSRILDMVIVDTPGLGATRDFVSHLKVHKELLSSIPIKMICCIIKYEKRNDYFEREMNEFLDVNSGLKSRFNYVIEFPDYSPEELLQISTVTAAKNNYTIDPKSNKALLKYFTMIL